MKALYIYDCATGKLRVAKNFPLLVGNTEKCGCKMDMDPGSACLIMQNGNTCTLHPQTPMQHDGETLTAPLPLPENKEILLCGGRGAFILYYMETNGAPPDLMRKYDCNSWFIHDAKTGRWQGPVPLHTLAAQGSSIPVGTWLSMVGGQDTMCKVEHLLGMARRLNPGAESAFHAAQPQAQFQPQAQAQFQPQAQAQFQPQAQAQFQPQAQAQFQPQAQAQFQPQAQAPAPDLPEEPAEDTGLYTCPICWLKFDAGDVMNIACHPDLMGDEVLGRSSMKRFLATRFNARGQALDAMGTPCTDMACPHCRAKLPPHFLDSSGHIFSIIGAPSSGKSYYLASLVHEMERTMALRFNLSWRDADPTGNTMLNDVTNRLFNSCSAEQAFLSKTDLDGALYAEFRRHGRMVKLPKPFVYDVSPLTGTDTPTTLIFYDNAGEHFEPGRNSEDSPGSRHVSVADGLFFLFDPTTSPKFRRIIGDHPDPQLAPDAAARLDQQNVIMAETATRISTILNLLPGEKVDKPMAIMLGKCDLWQDKLEQPLLPIVENGCIHQANVDANSQVLRNFLIRLHPSLCTTAEIISSSVRYFAISPLGCSPVTFTDPATGDTKIGPDPARINPINVCDPTLWVLSQLNPELIPSV